MDFQQYAKTFTDANPPKRVKDMITMAEHAHFKCIDSDSSIKTFRAELAISTVKGDRTNPKRKKAYEIIDEFTICIKNNTHDELYLEASNGKDKCYVIDYTPSVMNLLCYLLDDLDGNHQIFNNRDALIKFFVNGYIPQEV